MKYLKSDPEIIGGALAITGTRINIAVVFHKLAAGETISDMLVGWPWLSEKILRGAIDEAIAHFETVSPARTTHAS
jgi:uncharacterized protein (DUF433 family)